MPDPFRELLATLPDEIALAREAGLPVVLEVAEPLRPHARRLMDTLGVEVREVTATVTHEQITCPVKTCSWSWVGDPGKAQPYLDAHLKLMHASPSNARREPEGLDLLEQMDRGEQIAGPAPTEKNVMPEVVCKVEGCGGDASDAPKTGPTSRLCAEHRAERRQQMSAARIGKPRGTKTSKTATTKTRSRTAQRRPRTVPDRAAAPKNGSHASKAERLLAAARAVDEIEAQLEQARAELKEAAAELA